jgi:hypothetical protein
VRRITLLALCVVLCTAAAATATTIDVVFPGQNYAGFTYPAMTYENAISYTRTAVTVSGRAMDRLDFYLNDLSALSAGGGPWGTPVPGNTNNLTILEGFWTATGDGMYFPASGASSYDSVGDDFVPDTNWVHYTDSSYNAQIGGNHSYLTLPYLNNLNVGWTRQAGVGADMASLVYGSWADLSAVGLPINSRFARIFVSPGANVTFTSTTGPLNDPRGILYAGGWSFKNGTEAAGSFTTTAPEPSTLIFMATALFGLLSTALRRKSK